LLKIKTDEQRDINESLVLSLVKEKSKLWKKGSRRNLHILLKEEFWRYNIMPGIRYEQV
jgi:hypothetical protein